MVAAGKAIVALGSALDGRVNANANANARQGVILAQKGALRASSASGVIQEAVIKSQTYF